MRTRRAARHARRPDTMRLAVAGFFTTVLTLVWAHALAYNLIRTVIAQAATENDLQPRTISFKGALQTLEAFRPAIALLGHSGSTRRRLYRRLLDAATQHRVGDRPNRFEPRRIKRRHKHYVPLAVPRHVAKLQILKGLAKN